MPAWVLGIQRTGQKEKFLLETALEAEESVQADEKCGEIIDHLFIIQDELFSTPVSQFKEPAKLFPQLRRRFDDICVQIQRLDGSAPAELIFSDLDVGTDGMAETERKIHGNKNVAGIADKENGFQAFFHAIREYSIGDAV